MLECAQTEVNWVKQASKLLKRNFQGLRMVLEQDSDGDVLTVDEWKQLCVEMNRLEGGIESGTEESFFCV